MEIVYDPSKFRAGQLIIIDTPLRRGHNRPIGGMLMQPPIVDGCLRFVEIDKGGRMTGTDDEQNDTVKVHTKRLDDAGVAPYESGAQNAYFRTGVCEDMAEFRYELTRANTFFEVNRDSARREWNSRYTMI